MTEAPKVMTLRERRQEQLRSEVERTALRLFARDGYDNVTIDDIVAAVGISVRTFFRHFPAKEEILVAELRRSIDRIAADVAARPPEESAVEALRHALLSNVSYLEVDREASSDWFRTLGTNPTVLAKASGMALSHRDAVTDLLAARLGVDSSLDPRPAVITAAMFMAVEHSSRMWREATSDRSLLMAAEDALAMVAPALRALEEGVHGLSAAPTRTPRATTG